MSKLLLIGILILLLVGSGCVSEPVDVKVVEPVEIKDTLSGKVSYWAEPLSGNGPYVYSYNLIVENGLREPILLESDMLGHFNQYCIRIQDFPDYVESGRTLEYTIYCTTDCYDEHERPPSILIGHYRLRDSNVIAEVWKDGKDRSTTVVFDLGTEASSQWAKNCGYIYE